MAANALAAQIEYSVKAANHTRNGREIFIGFFLKQVTESIYSRFESLVILGTTIQWESFSSHYVGEVRINVDSDKTWRNHYSSRIPASVAPTHPTSLHNNTAYYPHSFVIFMSTMISLVRFIAEQR